MCLPPSCFLDRLEYRPGTESATLCLCLSLAIETLSSHRILHAAGETVTSQAMVLHVVLGVPAYRVIQIFSLHFALHCVGGTGTLRRTYQLVCWSSIPVALAMLLNPILLPLGLILELIGQAVVASRLHRVTWPWAIGAIIATDWVILIIAGLSSPLLLGLAGISD